MIRIEKTSRLTAEQIIRRASEFFGEGGEGLEQTGLQDCCVSFAGGGGHVTVFVADEKTHRTVDVESREFEYQAKRFLESV
ncbi:MAG: hypothetical protein HY895_02150 [Deltaproteobacteria bacterium]|nr:hypothetical protein [Deltaproteobacteria bacterium]